MSLTSEQVVAWIRQLGFLHQDDGGVTVPDPLPVAEGTAGTATTTRTVRADWLKQIINHFVTGSTTGAVSAIGQSLVTAATQTAARAAIGAGTGNSNLTLGTTADTAAAGNDSRLSDTRTPTDGTVTNTKVASDAAIALSKLAAGHVKGLDNTTATTLTAIVVTEAEYTAYDSGAKADATNIFFRL